MKTRPLLYGHYRAVPLTRAQRLLITLIVLGAVVAGVASSAAVIRGGDPHGVLLLITILVLTWSYAASGLLLGLFLRAGPTVVLLLAIGTAWLIRALTLVDGPAAEMATVAHPVIWALLVQLLVTFPGSRSLTRPERVLAVGNLVMLPVLIVDSFANPSGRTDPCLVCLPSATADPPLTVLSAAARAGTVAIAALLVWCLWRRRAGVGAGLFPALVLGVLVAVQIMVSAAVPLVDRAPGAGWVVINAAGVVIESLLPLAMLVGMVLVWSTGTAVQASELAARSRAQARSEIQRNLHDGAQLRLLGAAIRLKLARTTLAGGEGDVAAQLSGVEDDLGHALAELRGLVRGETPPALARLGLRGALADLAAAAPLAVTISGEPAALPPRVAETAYFLVAEALSNAARHSQARQARVSVTDDVGSDGHPVVRVEVTDDGVGNADARSGRGLTKLAERVIEVGGLLDVSSPAGVGTSVVAVIPCASWLQTTRR